MVDLLPKLLNGRSRSSSNEIRCEATSQKARVTDAHIRLARLPSREEWKCWVWRDILRQTRSLTLFNIMGCPTWVNLEIIFIILLQERIEFAYLLQLRLKEKKELYILI